MATRTWNSAGSTDMNDGNNYNPTGALLTADDLVFDDTSSVNAIQTAALSVQSIDVQTGFSGNFDQSGNDITTSLDVSFEGDGTGTLTLDGGLTITGDGNFTIDGTGWATISTSATLTDWDFQGDNTVTINSGGGGFFINTIDCAYSDKTTTVNIVTSIFPRTLTLGAGILDFTGASIFGVNPGGSDPLVLDGNHSITSSVGSTDFYIRLAAAGLSINVPQVNASGFTNEFIAIAYNASRTYSLTHTGSFTVGDIFRVRTNVASTGTLAYNTGNYDITASGEVSIGSSNAAFTITTNLGSSTLSAPSFDGAIYNNGPHNFNLQTSTINISGDFSLGSNTTVDAGTATLTIDGAATITTSDEDFPNTILQVDTTFVGGCTLARLQIDDGVTVTFDAGETVTVTAYTSGDIDNTYLISSVKGTEYFFNLPGGAVTVNNVRVGDNNASGGATITDNNGADRGNNTNWVFDFDTATLSNSLAEKACVCVCIGV